MRKAAFIVNRRLENDDELLARDWLRSQGFKDIQRPSSDPPDFVVDGKFAVEVTRLSQRIVVGADKHSRGEERARIPLRDQIQKTIDQLGPPGNKGRSWVIDCEYDISVPLPNRKAVAAQISEALAPLLNPYDDKVVSELHATQFDFEKHAGEISYMGFPHLCLECGICIDLAELSHSPAKFILANVSDRKGIAVAEDLAIGIRNRLRTKSEAIRNQNKVGEYGSWWLILVDHVGLMPMQMLAEQELSSVQNQDIDFWNRIVVVSSNNADWHYDLRSW